jgi:nitroreductase
MHGLLRGELEETSMELMDVLRKRRAVREYTGAGLEAVTVERLIKAATLAPSAINLQPWAFAALLERKRIDEYAERAKSWLLENLAETGFGERFRQMLEDPSYSLFYHAAGLVLVLAKSEDRQSAEDCCMAAEHLMLAARDEEIGTCWIGLARPWLNLASTKKELGLPEDWHVVAPIVLGYAKTWPETPGRNLPEIRWLG